MFMLAICHICYGSMTLDTQLKGDAVHMEVVSGNHFANSQHQVAEAFRLALGEVGSNFAWDVKTKRVGDKFVLDGTPRDVRRSARRSDTSYDLSGEAVVSDEDLSTVVEQIANTDTDAFQSSLESEIAAVEPSLTATVSSVAQASVATDAPTAAPTINPFLSLDQSHELVIERQTCPVSQPQINVVHSDLGIGHFLPTYPVLSDSTVLFSSINIKGDLPGYVSRAGKEEVYTSVLDFASSQSLENFERVASQNAQGLRLDCRAQDSTIDTYTNTSMAEVYAAILDQATASTRLFRITHNSTHYSGYTCVTGSVRCLQTQACDTVDPELIVLTDTQLDRDTTLASATDVENADFQLFLFSLGNGADAASISMVGKEDASYSRGAVIDPFSDVVWDSSLNALVATRKAATTSLYHIDMVRDHHRRLRLYQADADMAASLADRVLQSAGQSTDTDFLEDLYDKDIVKIQAIPLGIMPHYVLNASTGAASQPSVDFDLARGISGVDVNGSTKYVGPIAQDSVTELPLQFAIVQLQDAWASTFLPTTLDTAHFNGEHEFTAVDQSGLTILEHVAESNLVVTTQDGKVHKRAIVKAQNVHGLDFGTCIAADYLNVTFDSGAPALSTRIVQQMSFLPLDTSNYTFAQRAGYEKAYGESIGVCSHPCDSYTSGVQIQSKVHLDRISSITFETTIANDTLADQLQTGCSGACTADVMESNLYKYSYTNTTVVSISSATDHIVNPLLQLDTNGMIGYDGDLPVCADGYVWGLIMTVVENEGVLLEGVHDNYNQNQYANITAFDGIQSAFGHLPTSTHVRWQHTTGGTYVLDTANSYAALPVVASRFKAPGASETFTHSIVTDDNLVATGRIGDTYPVAPRCPSTPARFCTNIGLPDTACDDERCGVVGYNYAYKGLTNMLWGEEYAALATGIQKSFFAYPGSRLLQDHDVTSWPVLTEALVSGETNLIAALGVTEALAIDFAKLQDAAGTITIGSLFDNGYRQAACEPQGGTFARMTALQAPNTRAITSTALSVNMSPLPDLVSATFIGGSEMVVLNDKQAFNGDTLTRGVDWFGNTNLEVRLRTRQLFTNLAPHLPVIHNIELQADSTETLGVSCNWQGYHEVVGPSRSIYSVTPREVEQLIKQVEDSELFYGELLDGRVVAFKATNPAGDYFWETATRVAFVLTSQGPCESLTQFTNARITTLEYSFHSASSNQYMNYQNNANETRMVYLSGMQPGTTFGHYAQLAALDVQPSGLTLSPISPEMITTMSTRQYTDVAVGPLNFDIATTTTLQNRSTVTLEYMESLAFTHSFVHGFAVTNNSCPTNTLADLRTISYMDGMPHRNFDNYATEIMDARGDEWLSYQQMTKHPAGTFTTWPKGECVQAYRIDDVLGHSGSASNFLVTTTELHLDSLGLSGYHPETEFAYAVACLKPRAVGAAFAFDTTEDANTISMTPVDLGVATCSSMQDMCDAGELTVHLRPGTKRGQEFLQTQMCVNVAQEPTHYNIQEFGEWCITSTDIFSDSTELTPVCVDNACVNETSANMTCSNSSIRAFEYEYGSDSAKHFKVDSDEVKGMLGAIRLTTITFDLGFFSRVASQARIKSFYEVALRQPDGQTRRLMAVSEARREIEAPTSRRMLQADDAVTDSIATGGTTIVALPECDENFGTGQLTSQDQLYCPIKVCNGLIQITNTNDGLQQNITCDELNVTGVYVLAGESSDDSDDDTLWIVLIVIASLNLIAFVGYRIYKSYRSVPADANVEREGRIESKLSVL